jgi:glyoxylase-like metal-dependent hydrolase (beta-lactamase superfamily II)
MVSPLRSLAPVAAALALTLAGCSSDDAATKPDAPASAGPQLPSDATDDAATLGPFAGDPIAVLGYKSSAKNGSVNSWLLMGKSDAALIDAQLVLSEGRAVAEMIKASGKTLKWVWITHGHPDHSTGLKEIVAAFPDAKVYAHPTVVAETAARFEQYKAPLNKFFPGDIPDAPVMPAAWEKDTLELEGTTINIHTFGFGEATFTTVLHVPAINAVFAADTVYHRVHPWLNEMNIAGVRHQITALERMDDVETIYPGHGEPVGKDYLATYRGYIDFFLDRVYATGSSGELIEKVHAQYPDWRSLAGLRFSANAWAAARESGQLGPQVDLIGGAAGDP